MSHRTLHPRAVPGALALACAVAVAANPVAHASASRTGPEPSAAFQAFRQMERDLVNGSGLRAPYRSEGHPGFGLRFYETH